MKFTLSQSSYELRDAGEVAFGILIMAILIAVGALLFATVFIAFSPRPVSLVSAGSVVWAAGMLVVLRHYWRATRSWTSERRGGGMLFLVECIVSIVSVAATFLLGSLPGELAVAIRFCLSGFLLLLVLSHVVTYALLRYRPRLKEAGAWTAVAVAIVVEFSKNT